MTKAAIEAATASAMVTYALQLVGKPHRQEGAAGRGLSVPLTWRGRNIPTWLAPADHPSSAVPGAELAC